MNKLLPKILQNYLFYKKYLEKNIWLTDYNSVSYKTISLSTISHKIYKKKKKVKLAITV